MGTNAEKSIPFELTFMLKNEPESSGFMDKLRKLGFDQDFVSGDLQKVKYTGNFTGTAPQFLAIISQIKKDLGY